MHVARKAYSIAIRIAAALAVAGVLFVLTGRLVAPDGLLTTSTDLVRPATFVSAPKPSERLAEPVVDGGETLSPLIGDPLYVDLTPPAPFDAVTMRLRFKNAGQPMVEIGALGSALDEQYDVRSAQSLLLDALPWGRVSSGRLSLYQRSRQYASVDDFLRHPPDRSKVAVYRTTAAIPYRLPGYAPLGAAREIDVSLRGSHRLVTYVQDEDLHFLFSVQDMNRQPGADPVVVSVYKDSEEKPAARTVLEDDGNTKDDQRSSKLRTVAVTLARPSAGVYVVEVTATADVFIRRISTRQRKLAFVDRIYLGDHVGYSDAVPSRALLMKGRRLTARTAHVDALQTLDVDGIDLAISEPHLKYSTFVTPRTGPVRVVAPKGDVLLETGGVFALSQEEFFDPGPMRIEWHTTFEEIKAKGIDYILAEYEPPATDGDLLSAEATFDADSLARTKEGAYRFVISAPGIDGSPAELRLASATFVMRRPPSSWFSAVALFASRFGTRQASAPDVLPGGRSFGETPQ
jgi:hypothetical protein